jgi:hypothetical protein
VNNISNVSKRKKNGSRFYKKRRKKEEKNWRGKNNNIGP